ncbi:DoxX family protein [Paenibacillus qinlingensis]|uniref:Membrane protein YphA (DoxX/SURF4 family) n=1 Tax=Paenibacillus qinlingensis TaxID=1837343 RepID=A0ABU1NY52_9BACL|nr:DoxX family protein [Paenibacillus qinlingensis]MDR6551752.1 putative membrane protein YphA (DoxX/SURF4 family) [Paenibacillus qinlingensis]
MNLALWIATGLLAVVALAGGTSKTFMSKERLAKYPGGGWVKGFPASFLKSIGVLEILAAVGLILPALLNIAPFMVPVTAICWVLVMIGAIIIHLRHGHAKPVVANLIYLALAVFIAWGRFE